MSAITGTVVISGNISPSDTIDTYATHVSIYGAGGLQEVLDLIERDAVTTERRREGMIVYVQSNGHYYGLNGGILNSNWIDFGTSLGGGNSKTIVTGTGGVINGGRRLSNDTSFMHGGRRV